jgi:hypothetical protein
MVALRYPESDRPYDAESRADPWTELGDANQPNDAKGRKGESKQSRKDGIDCGAIWEISCVCPRPRRVEAERVEKRRPNLRPSPRRWIAGREPRSETLIGERDQNGYHPPQIQQDHKRNGSREESGDSHDVLAMPKQGAQCHGNEDPSGHEEELWWVDDEIPSRHRPEAKAPNACQLGSSRTDPEDLTAKNGRRADRRKGNRIGTRSQSVCVQRGEDAGGTGGDRVLEQPKRVIDDAGSDTGEQERDP